MRNSKLATIFLMLLGMHIGFAGEFESANHLYEEGRFAEAKQSYEQLVARGPLSANLFYNLGNAEFRLGAPGRAALQYERALKLNPGHDEASRNLKLVREQSGARVFEKSWVELMFPKVALNILVILGAVTGWLAIGFVVVGLLAKTPRPFFFWMGCLLCMAAAAYCGAALWHHHRDKSLAIIVAKQVEARLAPADRAALAQTLMQTSRVHVLSERGEWVYCALPGKSVGWIPASALEKIVP